MAGFDNNCYKSLITCEYPNEENPWMLPIGVKDSGEVIVEDFNKIDNLIVSGANGFGKSSFVKALISEIMEENSPDKVRFLIYDSSKFDYKILASTPFLIKPIIVDPDQMMNELIWLSDVIDQRLDENNYQNEYPDIFLIVDDYFSCYSKCKTELENLLAKNQNSKVHCILVSSTFTRKTLSSELSSNVINRVSFFLIEKSMSTFLLGEAGAERITEPGMMLYKNKGKIEQCWAIKSNDISLEHNSKKYKGDYSYVNDESPVIKQLNQDIFEIDDHHDSLFVDAGRMVIEKDKASIGYIQRMFRIGFNRAATIMEQLEEFGVVGPEEGTKPRKILMTLDEFEFYVNL